MPGGTCTECSPGHERIKPPVSLSSERRLNRIGKKRKIFDTDVAFFLHKRKWRSNSRTHCRMFPALPSRQFGFSPFVLYCEAKCLLAGAFLQSRQWHNGAFLCTEGQSLSRITGLLHLLYHIEYKNTRYFWKIIAEFLICVCKNRVFAWQVCKLDGAFELFLKKYLDKNGNI